MSTIYEEKNLEYNWKAFTAWILTCELEEVEYNTPSGRRVRLSEKKNSAEEILKEFGLL
jgi:hypothetical protein